MALKKSMSTGSGISLPAVYYFLNAVMHDRLNGSLKVKVAAFRDAETRVAAKTALAAIMAANSALEAAVAEADKVDRQDELALAKARVTVSTAQVALRQAAGPLSGCQPLEFINIPEIDIGAAASASLLSKTGAPDYAKIYDHLKTLPAWKDCEDC